jgi:hypothetical protein
MFERERPSEIRADCAGRLQTDASEAAILGSCRGLTTSLIRIYYPCIQAFVLACIESGREDTHLRPDNLMPSAAPWKNDSVRKSEGLTNPMVLQSETFARARSMS